MKKNPLVRVKLRSPSIRTKKSPSKRLLDRRKRTMKAPPGYWANPTAAPEREKAEQLIARAIASIAEHKRARPGSLAHQGALSFAQGMTFLAKELGLLSRASYDSYITTLKNLY
jgi:hypothetical protein